MSFPCSFSVFHLLPNFLKTGGGASTVITGNGLLSDLMIPYRVVLYMLGFAFAGCITSFGLKIDSWTHNNCNLVFIYIFCFKKRNYN